MNLSARAATVAMAVVLIGSGCASPITRPLPAFTGGLACRGVGLDATIAGDPDAAPPVWLVDRLDGQRMEATWPPGAFARFGDKLEILLPDGTLFWREGDVVDGGCYTSDDGPWAVMYSRNGTLPTR